jgi:hypothetical protein
MWNDKELKVFKEYSRDNDSIITFLCKNSSNFKNKNKYIRNMVNFFLKVRTKNIFIWR